MEARESNVAQRAPSARKFEEEENAIKKTVRFKLIGGGGEGRNPCSRSKETNLEEEKGGGGQRASCN